MFQLGISLLQQSASLYYSADHATVQTSPTSNQQPHRTVNMAIFYNTATKVMKKLHFSKNKKKDDILQIGSPIEGTFVHCTHVSASDQDYHVSPSDSD